MKIALAQLNYTIGDIDGNVGRIIDAVRKKCEETGRVSFNFYQASYNSKTSQLEIEPIPLLSDIFQIPK